MWVEEMEKKLKKAEPSEEKVAKWAKQCIFRVPRRFKTVRGSFFKPKTVALGPFHHNDSDLTAMEEHKLRAVHHLLQRAGKSLHELGSAMDDVGDELEDAYMDLGSQWRDTNRGKFLEMMMADGCFLLEVMRLANEDEDHDAGKVDSAKKNSYYRVQYTNDDPFFSSNGIEHIAPFIKRDMLMIENQLPLSALATILAVENGRGQMDSDENDLHSINSMVLKFLESGEPPRARAEGIGLGLHPLDIYRKSQLKSPAASSDEGSSVNHLVMMPEPLLPESEGSSANDQLGGEQSPAIMPDSDNDIVVPRSAKKLADAGVRFMSRSPPTYLLDDIYFGKNRRTLEMPSVELDDSSTYKYLNLMEFEAMHLGTSNEVTAFVLFMKDLIDSAADVGLLSEKQILHNDLAGNDDAVVKLFNNLTELVFKNGKSELREVRRDVEEYYRKSTMCKLVHESWASLNEKYFRHPWTSITLMAAILLMATDIMQTAYAVMSYQQQKSGGGNK